MPSTHHCVLSLPNFPSCGSLLPGLSWSLSAPLHSAGIHLSRREWQERPLSSSFRCEYPEMQARSCRGTSLPEERSPSILLVLLWDAICLSTPCGVCTRIFAEKLVPGLTWKLASAYDVGLPVHMGGTPVTHHTFLITEAPISHAHASPGTDVLWITRGGGKGLPELFSALSLTRRLHTWAGREHRSDWSRHVGIAVAGVQPVSRHRLSC